MAEYLGPGSSSSGLLHYDRPGWTFHGKGMWFEQELSQVGGPPVLQAEGESEPARLTFTCLMTR